MSTTRRVIGDHLELRGGSTIYFRRAFPRWMWPHLGGARDFTRSLHTSDLGETEELRDALFAALDIAWRDGEPIGRDAWKAIRKAAELPGWTVEGSGPGTEFVRVGVPR